MTWSFETDRSICLKLQLSLSYRHVFVLAQQILEHLPMHQLVVINLAEMGIAAHTCHSLAMHQQMLVPNNLASSSLLCRISSENEATPAAPFPSPSTISAPSHLQHVHQTSMLLILHLTCVTIIIIGIQPIPPHRPSIAALLSVVKSYSVSIRSEWNWSETPHQASNPARRLLYPFILATACRGECPINCGSWNVIRIAVLLLKLWGIDEG